MKKLIFAIIILSLSGCITEKKLFSKNETDLLSQNGIKKETLADLKQSIKTKFSQYETSDPGYMIGEDGEIIRTDLVKEKGISFNLLEEDSEKILFRFREKLKSKGYLMFLSHVGFESPSTISIIPSHNKFDILRLQKTDGINYDVENEDVINKLKEWDKQYGIDIVGADYDWVDLILLKQIEDVPKLAKEVYSFCPDVVDQGVGTIEELEKILKEHNRVYLWWD